MAHTLSLIKGHLSEEMVMHGLILRRVNGIHNAMRDVYYNFGEADGDLPVHAH